MYQQSLTYIMTTENGWDVIMSADRTSASFPNNYMRNGISRRQTEAIAERDRFEEKTSMGIDGTGFSLSAWTRPGGYYLDLGASEVVVNGKIGLKNDSPISCFTETRLKFEDGNVMEADVVILLLALEITAISSARCTPIWRLDSDGEIRGTWRDLSVKGLWHIIGM
ncbi:hypothetical protein K435DRAFT_810130 [Dendrothele bispora CBS 962.96]|uniref:FAD/NAD(P)-binding domain-containing protein n=1 Tax=Dendrothele bispora (strain CBS 962.96) TaxID=1314807 RepID=A0A4S8KW18_DENBC|nr:hypothetical protein K435DRAFT_810130 [Dendrothele bispora CBS 962.96]